MVRAYRVHGRVQGVGFRAWTQRNAAALGLRGTVRNRSDGTVEVLVGGSVPAVTRLAALLRAGPPAARVDRVTEEMADPDSLPADGFQIVRESGARGG